MQRPRSTLELPFSEFSATGPQPVKTPDDFKQQLEEFRMFGEATRMYQTKTTLTNGRGVAVDTFVNEFWTAQQRRGHSLHEISYRACFKPQLPRFFIERLTTEGDTVYDPFMGRGTTLVEAALLGRKPLGCDANPLSVVLVSPRLIPPRINRVADRLQKIDFGRSESLPTDLLAFYHTDTLQEICALRSYLLDKQKHGTLDNVDAWIRMVAVNRLTGHS